MVTTMQFTYEGRTLRRGGLEWFCQTAGSRWALDPMHGGWELFFSDGRVWWLIGHGREIEMFPGLKDSMTAAARIVEEVRLQEGKEHDAAKGSCPCFGGPVSDDPADEHAPDCPARSAEGEQR